MPHIPELITPLAHVLQTLQAHAAAHWCIKLKVTFVSLLICLFIHSICGPMRQGWIKKDQQSGLKGESRLTQTASSCVRAIWVSIAQEHDTPNNERDTFHVVILLSGSSSFMLTGKSLILISQCFPRESSKTVLTTGEDIWISLALANPNRVMEKATSLCHNILWQHEVQIYS